MISVRRPTSGRNGGTEQSITESPDDSAAIGVPGRLLLQQNNKLADTLFVGAAPEPALVKVTAAL
jgi:hypothetical protein